MVEFAVTSQSELAREMLSSEDGAREFEGLLIACCLDSREFLDAAVGVLNFDAVHQDFSRNDFFDSTLGLIYEATFFFKQAWRQGNPWPANRTEWIKALTPWFALIFRKNPDIPVELKARAFQDIMAIPETAPGTLDTVQDGLMDFLYMVRYDKSLRKFHSSDPVLRMEMLDSVPRSINRPTGKEILVSAKETLHRARTGTVAGKPFATGLKSFDRYYGNVAAEGDAWLFFAGSGGGKSVVAGNIAVHSALEHGMKSVLLSTEMPPHTMLMRMAASAMKKPYEKVKKYLNPSMPCPYDDQIEEWLDRVDPFVMVQNYNDLAGATPEDKIMKLVDEFIRRHKAAPDIILLDWLGSALEQSFENAWQKQEVFSRLAQFMAKLADDLKGLSFTFAQAKATSRNKSAIYPADIKDCTGLDMSMEGVCGMTNLPAAQGVDDDAFDEEASSAPDQFWCVSKVREGKTRRLPVRQDFSTMRFSMRT